MSALTLLEPQRLIIDHLEKCPTALVYAGMGISKTAAVLHHLNNLFLSAEAVSALVIAPMRVASLTWPMECQKWSCFHWMKVVNLRTEHGQRAFLRGSAHIFLINYDAINLLVSLVERRRGTIPHDVEVWDECTRCKNPSSKRINLFRRKVPRTARRIAMSGTPMPNSELDLFAQVRLMDDGARLGTSSTNFKKEYFYPPENMFQHQKFLFNNPYVARWRVEPAAGAEHFPAFVHFLFEPRDLLRVSLHHLLKVGAVLRGDGLLFDGVSEQPVEDSTASGVDGKGHGIRTSDHASHPPSR